jgi:hypothetical protein
VASDRKTKPEPKLREHWIVQLANGDLVPTLFRSKKEAERVAMPPYLIIHVQEVRCYAR